MKFVAAGWIIGLCFHLTCWGSELSVRDSYIEPILTIPFCVKKPVIDGVVDDVEWEIASSVNALSTRQDQISSRQTRFWICWDEDNLYLAMRSPLRPGERVLQRYREKGRDINVVFDDSYEIWIDAGTTTPDGQPMYVQFLSNISGAKFDALHLPAVGNMRMSWDAYKEGWQVKNRITPDGNAWEWEIVIPRQSIYQNKPFANADKIRLFLVRNFKRTWEQNSFGGVGGFSVRKGYTNCLLSKNAPAVHLLSVDDPQNQSFGLRLGAYDTKNSTLKWQFKSDSGVTKEGFLKTKKEKFVVTKPMLSLDKPGKGSYRITIFKEDDQSILFDWASKREFGNLKEKDKTFNKQGNDALLNLSYNPIMNYVRVKGDFINYDNRNNIAEFVVELRDASDKLVKRKKLYIDNLAYVKGVLNPGKISYGEYNIILNCYDKKGKQILSRNSKFTKKNINKFPWWNTSHGNIEKVISPWTPVIFKRNKNDASFNIWGRKMKVGVAGLPAQVITQNEKLVFSPVRLEAQTLDGKKLVAVGKDVTMVSSKEHRVIIDVKSKLNDIAVTSRITVEFDGMYKVKMTLDPEKPVRLSSLKIIVPFANDAAVYINGCGEAPRYGYFQGFLPKKQKGSIWDCRVVDGQPMAIGTFIPYVWVGNSRGGMCWFADSDEGWIPNNKVPAIEIRRDSEKSTDLVFNLISSDFTVSEPRTITFAFQASPVKPLFKGWRMDSWCANDTFEDYSFVGEKGGHFVFGSIPFTLDKERCRKKVAKRKKATNGFIFGFNKYPANVVPYFEHIHMGKQFIPEYDYFAEAWENVMNQGRGLCYEKSLQDFMIHNLGEWSKATGIEGYYLDNLYPLACNNLAAGRGYRLSDGRIQPAFQMFDTRRYFLRLRAVFAEQGYHNKIVFHMTNNMIIPWVGAADIAFDGEDHIIYPGEKDFMDYWSLERMRNACQSQYGTVFNFMHEFQGNWDKSRLLEVMRSFTGLVALHDALPSGNANNMNTPFWIGRDRFGIEADDVKFLPYWDKSTGLRSATKNIYLAGWLRPGKLLLLVVNKGNNTDALVKIDSRKFGLPSLAECDISDAESGCTIKIYNPATKKHEIRWNAKDEKPFSVNSKGQFVVPVKRHNYRQIIIQSKPN